MTYQPWNDARNAVSFAAAAARAVLHVFEAAHPDDDRPRKAIEIAEALARGERVRGAIYPFGDAAEEAASTAAASNASTRLPSRTCSPSHAAHAAAGAAYTAHAAHAAAVNVRAATYVIANTVESVAFDAVHAGPHVEIDAIYVHWRVRDLRPDLDPSSDVFAAACETWRINPDAVHDVEAACS